MNNDLQVKCMLKETLARLTTIARVLLLLVLKTIKCKVSNKA